MSETIEKRLSDLGVAIPAAAAPAANYVPYC
ncbi:MAG: RidA family protein, partial [Mesorhizobium sp.]